MTQYNLNTIRPLIFLCNFLAIGPPFSLNSGTTRYERLFKFYGIFALTLTVSITIISTIELSVVILQSFNSTQLLVHYIYTIFMALLSVTIISTTVFIYSSDLKKILQKVAAFDGDVDEIRSKKRKVFWTLVFLHHILFGTAFAIDMYECSYSITWTMKKLFIITQFQYYQLTVAFFLVIYFALELYWRFKRINSLLSETEPLNRRLYSMNQNKSATDNKLKRIALFYQEVCELTSLFNKTFGLILLLGIVAIIILLVNYFAYIIEYVFKKKEFADTTYGLDLMIVCVFWCLTAAVIEFLCFQYYNLV